MLKKSVIARIMAWAAAYKLRLPQNESWVRGLVFSAFRGKPVSQVNRFLRDFYEERVEGIFRDEIDRLMRRHLEAGDVVICVSATFEPIIAKAMTCHPIQFGIATRMQIDGDGCYTDRVDGLPVEGSEKVVALTAFADELFGAGNWQLDWAYGDHHSDRDLLCGGAAWLRGHAGPTACPHGARTRIRCSRYRRIGSPRVRPLLLLAALRACFRAVAFSRLSSRLNASKQAAKYDNSVALTVKGRLSGRWILRLG